MTAAGRGLAAGSDSERSSRRSSAHSQVEGGKASSGEVLPGGGGGGEEDRLKDQGEEPPEVLKAVPTFILGGTLQGAVFRANLATNQTVADSGNLVCTMEWYKVGHPESLESD